MSLPFTADLRHILWMCEVQYAIAAVLAPVALAVVYRKNPFVRNWALAIFAFAAIVVTITFTYIGGIK
jgi:hypothetical protein